jgi:hypothetical protein
MSSVRYGQAALIAVIMTLTGNTVWAQEAGQYNVVPHGVYFSTQIGCKAGTCSKDGDCCCKSGKCEAKCACCKDNKCECKDGSECCCAKSGKCCCGKDRTSVEKDGCGCPFLGNLAKRTAIIMVMPSSLPLPVSCCMEAMGMLPHPPMPPFPPGPHVFLPPMPTPIPMPHVEPSYGDVSYGVRTVCPPGCVPCSNPSPVAVAKVRIAAASSSDQLAMCVGEETSICYKCKKMTVKICDNEITVTRFDDRVRVRCGEELKATADCVCTDGKDRLILEGNVVMHCKKEGRSFANVMKGEHIEVNLSNGAVTIKQHAETAVIPTGYAPPVVPVPYK